MENWIDIGLGIELTVVLELNWHWSWDWIDGGFGISLKFNYVAKWLSVVVSEITGNLSYRHDERLLQKNSRVVQQPAASQSSAKFHTSLHTQQFGVSLQFIKDNNNGEVIPPVVRQCVEFLSQPDGECVHMCLILCSFSFSVLLLMMGDGTTQNM